MAKMSRTGTAAVVTTGPARIADEALCRSWYEAHGSAVYNYFRFLVRSPDDAEELTAETFLRVVRHASRFDEARASARTWILRIAQNVMRDQWRTERRRKHVPVDSFRDLAIDAPSQEERLIHEERVAVLLQGIATLPEQDQELISLRYSGGLEHREIAALLGIREAAVRTRLWRAIGRLKDAVSGGA